MYCDAIACCKHKQWVGRKHLSIFGAHPCRNADWSLMFCYVFPPVHSTAGAILMSEPAWFLVKRTALQRTLTQRVDRFLSERCWEFNM